MLEIVLATRNEGKIREIKRALSEPNIRILTNKYFSGFRAVEEDRDSFRENAIKKALVIAQFTGKIALADDSGLEVDALGGEPGVHSAYFAGRNASDSENNEKLLRLMKDIPVALRTATFKCVIAIATPAGDIEEVQGICRGFIGLKPEGENGFGYDPLFIVPKYKKTFAQFPVKIKNRISHRGKALEKAKQMIKGMLAGINRWERF